MRMDSVQQYNDYFGVETLHPLVSVIDGSKAKPLRFCRKLYNVYAVLLKDAECGSLKYGRSIYDYQKGTMLFIAPGQVMGSEDDGLLHQPEGWVLVFHPEFLRGTPLASILKEYSYFSYSSSEALHLSERERTVVVDCMKDIAEELCHPIDKHSHALIADGIKLLLDRCIRFYDRQFAASQTASNDILARFERLCDEYYESGQPKDNGLLTVQYCADRLCFSVNYLSDLIRECTGQSPQKHIQRKTLARAELLLLTTSLRINEIASELGFQQPQNFSKWFKRLEGCSPEEYRKRR